MDSEWKGVRHPHAVSGRVLSIVHAPRVPLSRAHVPARSRRPSAPCHHRTMAALADMDLGALKAQLALVEAAVAAKQHAADGASTLASTIKNPYSKLYDRVSISAVHACPDKGASLIGATLVVGGWVKTGRVADKGALCFLELNDGTGPVNLQCVVRSDVHAIDELKATGTCVVVEGVMKTPPEGASQIVELHVTKVLHLGPCDAATYPIAKKKISLEFLREKIHLRTRTNTIAAIARIRSALSYATHTFFHNNGFLYVHTPLITQSDCEGAGEMFQVTTLLQAADAASDDAEGPSKADVQVKREAVTAAGEHVTVVKEASKLEGGDKTLVKPAVDAMLKLKNELTEMEIASRKIGGILRDEHGKIEYKEDFFGEPTFLTVSGQLNVETYACAMTSVYTFGPTFRAENRYVFAFPKSRPPCFPILVLRRARYLCSYKTLTTFRSQQQQHHAPLGRVLDDRARNRVRGFERRHAVRGGLRAALFAARPEKQPPGPGVPFKDVRQGEFESHRKRGAERVWPSELL